MFSSLHTSVGFAVVGAVVGEYLGSAAGLGYLFVGPAAIDRCERAEEPQLLAFA